MRCFDLKTALMALLFAGCELLGDSLTGRWRAVQWLSDSAAGANQLPKDSIVLIFEPDGAYRYLGAAYYEETGRYKVAWRYLFLTDTLHQPDKEYTLRIERLDADTLVLGMQRDSAREWITFVRL